MCENYEIVIKKFMQFEKENCMQGKNFSIREMDMVENKTMFFKVNILELRDNKLKEGRIFYQELLVWWYFILFRVVDY